MLLRDIGLYLDPEEPAYSDRLSYRFSFETRCLCNFIQRRVRKARIKTEGFSKLNVRGCQHPQDDCPLVPESAVRIEIYFDRHRYDKAAGDDLQEFFIAMLEEGWAKCAKFHKLPLKLLRDPIQDFRAGGYKNEWVHKSKRLGKHGLRGTLHCELTMKEFVLTLTVSKRDKIVFEKPIFREMPDELCFHYHFKDLKVRDDTLIVTTWFDTEEYGPTELFRLPLADLVDDR